MNMLLHLALCMSLAEALSPWNSSDQEKQLANHKDEQAKNVKEVSYLKDLDDDVTKRLNGNVTIQGLLKGQVQSGQQRVATAKQTVNETATATDQAQQAANAAKNAMDGASKTLSDDQGALKTAQANMDDASKKYSAAVQASQAADLTQKKAQQAVDAALQSGGPQLASALTALDSAKKSAAAAEKAKEDIASFKDGVLKTLQDAQNKEKRAQADLDSKSQISKTADGNLAAAKQKQADAQKSLDAKQAFAGKQQDALNVQNGVVKSLQEEKATKDNNLKAATETKQKLPGTISHDEDCIGKLKAAEHTLADQEKNWKSTLDNYNELDESTAPARAVKSIKSSLWAIRETIEETTYALTQTQKDCAPIDIPDRKPPEKCETETGGTCAWLWCFQKRNAICVAGKCVCQELMCAETSDGVCQPRNDPLDGDHGPGTWAPPLALTMAKKNVAFDSPFEQENSQALFVVGAMVAVSAMVMFAFAKLQRREIHPPETLLG